MSYTPKPAKQVYANPCYTFRKAVKLQSATTTLVVRSTTICLSLLDSTIVNLYHGSGSLHNCTLSRTSASSTTIWFFRLVGLPRAALLIPPYD
jgi:hypothetical protein